MCAQGESGETWRADACGLTRAPAPSRKSQRIPGGCARRFGCQRAATEALDVHLAATANSAIAGLARPRLLSPSLAAWEPARHQRLVTP